MLFPHIPTLIEAINDNLPAKASATSEDETGSGIDLVALGQYHSGVALCHVGAPSGAPASFSVAFTIEESDDNSTWTTAKNSAGENATVTRTTAGTVLLDFFPNQRKQHVRLRRATTITGGSTPRVPTAGLFLFAAGRII